jgi:hypothetical protein
VVARFSTGSYLLSRSDVEAVGVPVQEQSLQEVELRCPTGPRKLFAKLRLAGIQPSVTTDNLIELACQDCRRRFKTEGRDVQLVLHRFNIVGDLIETIVVDREG